MNSITAECKNSKFKPEERFILRCVDAAFGAELNTGTISEQKLDWEQILTITGNHGITHLVLDVLRTQDIAPPEVIEMLKSRAQYRSHQNLQMVQELVEVVQSLRNRGIRTIPYKGPVVAKFAYGDIGRREFGDLDLLVSRGDLPEARTVLSQHGYLSQYEFTEDQEWVDDRVNRDHPLRNSENSIQIELHWRIVDRHFPTKIDFESVWRRHKSLTLANTELPVLSPEDRLLMLCVHGTRHRWERLQWICDVAAYLQRCSFDWDRFEKRARANRCERMAYLGLAVANKFLDTPLSEKVQQKVQSDPAIPKLLSYVYGNLFSRENHIKLKKYQSRTLRRPRDKLRFWLGEICKPTPADITMLALPRVLAPLYVGVRWVRLSQILVSRLLESRFE